MMLEVEGCEARAWRASRRNERLILWAALATSLVLAAKLAGWIA
ncbi:MAG: hypothetical protein ACHQ1G_05820 [Planctomycetota bacterium]